MKTAFTTWIYWDDSCKFAQELIASLFTKQPHWNATVISFYVGVSNHPYIYSVIDQTFRKEDIIPASTFNGFKAPPNKQKTLQTYK